MSTDQTDRDAAPADPAQDNAVRGWQMLAERRGQEAEALRTERDSYKAKAEEYENAVRVRQLAEDYPDAAELYLQQGAERITPADEPLLAAMQAAIGAREPLIDRNSPRRQLPKAPSTVAELEAALRALPWEGDG
jgi:hypothetical protein